MCIRDRLLSGLADNGGPTQTMALQPGSPAIDAGDAAVCAATPVGNRDQRGVIRTLGASCDIGAYESGASVLRVTASIPADGARLQDVTTLAVTFNEDAVHDGGAQAANNPANYLLVERGVNRAFDTQSCEIGPQVDDVRQTISSVTYSDRGGTGPFTAILNLKAPLAAGVYRLYACGTTSIWSAAGLELNNGASDTLINFSVPARASAIPATGFAPGRVTALQAQPEEKTYGDLGSLWLEVPKLGVKMAIVGVPLTDGQWDVTWLGSSAGWLEGSAYPTWQGNSVLTGHVWNADNTAGPFRDLQTLGWGDEVIVHLGDQAYVYSVRSSQEVQPAKVGALLKPEEQAWLTLVTCKGYDENKGEYNSRILVRAVLLEVR
jgi:LPXTG-site transpeptidase (sortase) family protein